MTKLHELTGYIVSKESRKVYHKNDYYGNLNYKIKVLSEETKQYLTIFVYANLSPDILKILEQNQYLDKKYFFIYYKRKTNLILQAIKELSRPP
jgi:hypothetical protein